jgi:hypothetical protein
MIAVVTWWTLRLPGYEAVDPNGMLALDVSFVCRVLAAVGHRACVWVPRHPTCPDVRRSDWLVIRSNVDHSMAADP